MDSLIVVAPYNPNWKREFEFEARRISNLVASDLCGIHWIGSTSVEGLPAKPIIDILLELRADYDPGRLRSGLGALGYEALGEFGIPRREYFRKGPRLRTHQIHAFPAGDANATRHLAFRDYLRAHPDVRDEYARTKQEAARACGGDIGTYMDLKGPFIQRIERLAMEGYARRSRESDSCN